ncbi:MAG: histidine kinase dimerization/phosphoacceptor domain -containing protein [Chitinophagaceae bacterium]|nr:histidine kinase dimerization/phosphoacceptor domain -containing protein [Chitinophagaceae bacterium]
MRFLLLQVLFFSFFGTASGQNIFSLSFAKDSLRVNDLLNQCTLAEASNIQKSIQLANEALSIAEKINWQQGTGRANALIGHLLTQKKDYLNAITHLEKARAVFQSTNDEFNLAQVLKKTGDVYALRSYFRQSFDNYREATFLLRKTNQQAMLAECQEGMGNIAVSFGRYKNAVGYFQRSLALKKNLGDEKGIMTITNKLSLAYMNGKQYDSALYFIKQLQKKSPPDSHMLVGALSNEGIIYSFLNRPGEASAALKHADDILPAENNNDEKVKICIAKTVYYMATEDKAMTKKYFDSVANLVTGSRNPEVAITGFNYLAEINSIKGDYKTAYDMVRQSEKYKDVFRTENIDRMRAESENASELTLKQKEIEYLNLANKLKAEQLSKEEFQRLSLLRENLLKDSSLANQKLLMTAMETEANLRRLQLEREKELRLSLSRENELKQQLLNDDKKNNRILWTGIGALALSGAVIFIQYRRQLKKNDIIHKQSEELHVLNKEIHHRVKNNLQVISSMLDLQSQTLHDDKATAIIKEGIQRVQSMAFIHQNLYQGNAVNSVNMNEYIKMLSGHLFQSYNIQPEKIKLHTEIENFNLHTDTAIPLGMILNELISNALKYAFKGREKGEIWVNMRKNNNELLLQVKDNGVGLPQGFNTGKTSSFGYEIINAFAQKLKARTNIESNNGTDVQIIISKFKTA